MQEDDRPQRHSENDRSKVRRRHRERGNPDHEQHGERCMLRADDQASEREHRPIRDDHTDLREDVNADEPPAGEIEGQLGQPEGERRSQIRAKLKLVTDREHVCQLAGRAGIEQHRHEYPQQRLDQCRQPYRYGRARPQQLDEDGNVKHRPIVVEGDRQR